MKTTGTAPQLEGREIQDEVHKRLEKYQNQDVLVQFAMFMGYVQILELGLKRLLAGRYGLEADQIETWTLGRTTGELKKRGLRQDFIALLESLVAYRNYVAHEFLASLALLRDLMGEGAERLELGRLRNAIYELEQLLFLHDWCEEHDAWT